MRKTVVFLAARALDAFRYSCILLGTVFSLLFIGHYLLGAGIYIKHLVEGRIETGGDARAFTPVYANDPDGKRLWRDFSRDAGIHFAPYYHWRRNPFHSDLVNVDENGLRRTVKAPLPHAKKVFVFGGSTVWGTGTEDADTIPSLLQKKLGPKYDVYNFGETGFVAAQELNLLLEELAKGNVPDIVVFYDGVNDTVAGAWSPAKPRHPQNAEAWWNEYQQLKTGGLFAHLFHLLRQSNYGLLINWLQSKGVIKSNWDAKVAVGVESRVDRVLGAYEAHIRQVRALAKEYGFRAYFFWQPYLLSLTRKGLPYEQAIIKHMSPVLVEASRMVYKIAERRFSDREEEGVFFLGHLLDHVDEPIYIDWCHLGPNGNAVVAAELFRSLKTGL